MNVNFKSTTSCFNRRKGKQVRYAFLLVLCLAFLLPGCSVFQNAVAGYASNKEPCTLVTEDVTRFTYKGEEYTILADTVSTNGLGEWVGYIRRLVALDEQGAVLLQ